MNTFKLFSDAQHGFGQGKSTETAAHEYIQFIQDKMDTKKYVAGILFDFSRAFDTVCSDFVQTKLFKIGIRDNILKIITSFLSNRRLTVRCNATASEQRNIEIGLAQGSVLDPTIFLLFINDIQHHIKTADLLLNYADDTSVVVTGDTLEELDQKIVVVKKEMDEWCKRNRILLNKDKTQCIYFYKNSVPKTNNETTHVKLLGVYIDQRLKWNEHCDHICGKLSSAYYALKSRTFTYIISL
ncbi:Reverse transcriptase (RNA-dependent DNA polymerase) [Popillia japonica]|uniref:Reverse transcriptase (RNA-dependent DNA polymerase) n=1 Tax=Popillia japonica TaxID=7064 RepID=A0AAW1HRV5_POPJA